MEGSIITVPKTNITYIEPYKLENGQKLKLMEGSIITVPKTNIAYIEPYKLEINGDTYLIFGENEIMYISKNNIKNKISLQELEEVIRNVNN